MSLLFACLQRTGLLGLALVLVACGARRQTNDSSSGGKGFKLTTTFLPITLFTKAVAGDGADVTALIPPNTGPHDFQSKPGDLAALREAQVLVKNGLEMEAFLDKLVSSSGYSQLVVIDASRGVTTIDSPEEPGHDEAAPSQEQGHGHSHGAVNPHIWLDPLRAVQQVENIRDGLVKADPSCAEGYRRNGADLRQAFGR